MYPRDLTSAHARSDERRGQTNDKFLRSRTFGIRALTRLVPGGDRGLAPVGESADVMSSCGCGRRYIVLLALDAGENGSRGTEDRARGRCGSAGPAAHTPHQVPVCGATRRTAPVLL